MRILIHTYGRAHKQITWRYLPKSIQNKTTLVIQDREKHLYPDYPTLVLPPEYTRLAPTRQWLVDNLQAKSMCIIDDDLSFAVRSSNDRKKFIQPSNEDVENMFSQLQACIEYGYALAGISAREGANYLTDTFLWNTRQMRIHAINLDIFRKENIRFDEIEVMEDFHITLQCLRKGYSNIVCNEWVTNQAGSNAEGGCAHYRTAEVQMIAVHKLAALHPNFVSVVKKKTKVSWGGKERYDVRIQWKQAFKSAETVRILCKREGGNT